MRKNGNIIGEPGDPNRYGFADKILDIRAKPHTPTTPNPDGTPRTGTREAPKMRGSRTNKERRQLQFLALICDGKTQQQACNAVGVQPDTAERWLARDENFKTSYYEAVGHRRAANLNQSWVDDFVSFRREMFSTETYDVHMEMVRILSKHRIGNGLHMLAMFLIWPGSGKTTTIADWVCQILAYEPNARILILSETASLSRKMVQRIRRRLYQGPEKEPSRFVQEYGPFYVKGQEKNGKPWRSDYFVVNGADHDEMNYSVECKGMTSQIYGDRYDYIIIDDPQSRKSLSKTEDFAEIIRGEVKSRLDPDKGGILLYVGTRIAENDLPNKLLNEKFFPIGNVVTAPIINIRGESACPERFPLSKIEGDGTDENRGLRQQTGEPGWSTMYMLRPNAARAKAFPDEAIANSMVNELDNKRLESDDREIVYYASIDPAIAGFCSITLSAGVGDSYVLLDQWCHDNLASFEQIYLQVDSFLERYKPQYLCFESQGWQAAMIRDERLIAICRKHGTQLRDHKTGGRKNQGEYGVLQMASSWQAGEIMVANKNPAVFSRLRQELAKWRSNASSKVLRQDNVMSVWFGWVAWKQDNRADASESAWETTACPMPFEESQNHFDYIYG